MKLLRVLCLFCLLCCFGIPAHAQYFDMQKNRKHIVLPFRIIRNMIVIKLKINGKGPFNFVLDTGVGMMIITEPSLVDSIDLASKKLIKIAGLGEGEDSEAYITSLLNVQIPGLESHDVNAAILKKDHFNLSSYAGMPIHGLLGYEFFAHLAVSVDLSDSTLSVCRPKDLHHMSHADRIPITVEDRKPYLHSLVTYTNGKTQDCKLVIDIGAGHPISLEDMVKTNGMPAKYIAANLGVGLNGPINGYISRISAVQLGKYDIKDVIAAFPDSREKLISAVPRDGNMGMGILKRFNLTFDYPDSALYLKPGSLRNEPFEHDMSGLEYYAGGQDLHHVVVSRVEPGSAADSVGIEKGDEIVSINFKSVDKMSLEEIDALFKSRPNRSILLEVYHDNRYDNVILVLRRRI
jgi:hypothetical protein